MFDYWKKQEGETLFPELEWARPENKSLLPKIALVGGSSQGFSKTAAIYQKASSTGCGSLKMILPDALKESLPSNTDFVFVKSNKTKSFGLELFDTVRAISTDTNLLVISEDSGKESETTQSIHKTLQSDIGDTMFVGQSALFNDNYFDETIVKESKTVFVVSTPQLQKIASRLPTGASFSSKDGLVDIVKGLHEITKVYTNFIFVVSFKDTTVIASDGDVYSIKYADDLENIAGVISSYHYGEYAKNYMVALESQLQ